MWIAEDLRLELQTSELRYGETASSLNMGYTLHISESCPIQNPLSWWISDPVQSKSAWTGLDYESSGLIQSIPYSASVWAADIGTPFLTDTHRAKLLYINCLHNHNNSQIIKGSMPPRIGHMELLARMQRADFSEHIQRFKPHGNPLNSLHFDAPNTKFAPTGYRRAPNIISVHYK